MNKSITQKSLLGWTVAGEYEQRENVSFATKINKWECY